MALLCVKAGCRMPESTLRGKQLQRFYKAVAPAERIGVIGYCGNHGVVFDAP